ncbi:U-Asilidin(12)-Dg3b-like [Augochlora pura]
MKTTLFIAFFCLAAVAVMAVPAENPEGQEEYDVANKVEELDDAPVVEPLISCQLCGNPCCNAHCITKGKKSGSCNSDKVCVCRN